MDFVKISRDIIRIVQIKPGQTQWYTKKCNELQLNQAADICWGEMYINAVTCRATVLIVVKYFIRSVTDPESCNKHVMRVSSLLTA